MTGLGDFARLLLWTYKNDFIEPFPEIVLFLSIVIVVDQSFLYGVDVASGVFANISWNLILLIIIFVGIGGSRSYGIALDRGEAVHQMLALRIPRWRFAFLKWLALFVTFASILLVVDFVAFFVYLGYFPSVSAYSLWGGAPLVTFGLAVGEQLALLFFLNSAMLMISFGVKRTTASLLIFLVFALLAARLYAVGPPGILGDFQLGYGDYNIVNSFSTYLFTLFYRPASQLANSSPSIDVVVGLLYRVLGGLILLLGGIQLFRRSDLD